MRTPPRRPSTAVSLIDDSRIVSLERFGPGEGAPEGTVKLAAFRLGGREFMARNSVVAHEFTFTGAISFMVHCETQAEVDHLWDSLAEGGEPSQCGWLTDRYGVTWQIVPTVLYDLLGDPDPERSGRAMKAMLAMTKLDIATLREAAGADR